MRAEVGAGNCAEIGARARAWVGARARAGTVAGFGAEACAWIGAGIRAEAGVVTVSATAESLDRRAVVQLPGRAQIQVRRQGCDGDEHEIRFERQA